MSGREDWTDVPDLIAVLRKRWARGRYLRAHAAGVPFEPVRLGVKGPRAEDLLHDLDAARGWLARFERDSHAGGRARFAVEYRTITSRHVGANRVPARIVIESFDQLCRLLGTVAEVRSLDAIMVRTAEEVPALVPWVQSHPMAALESSAIWPDLLVTVAWISANGSADLYLRHVDLPGIDTKFIERNEQLLTRLLQSLMSPEQIEEMPRGVNFARRFGYLTPPQYTRFRRLDPALPSSAWPFPAHLSEVSLRTSELAGLPLPVRRVFVVENEVSYLAFPAVPDAVAVFGAGFASTARLDLPWLSDREVVYWGDIDTYGFDILDRLRARLPAVRSILMDVETLLGHSSQWVVEPIPTNRGLLNLTPEESALYRDLVEDRYGHHVRLEQERIRFGLVRKALEPWR